MEKEDTVTTSDEKSEVALATSPAGDNNENVETGDTDSSSQQGDSASGTTIGLTSNIPTLKIVVRKTRTPVKKLRPLRHFSYQYTKSRYFTLHEAVALSMGTSPGLIDTDDDQMYIDRCGFSRHEMHAGGAIKVIEIRKSDSGTDWIIDRQSFVVFALARGWGRKYKYFKALGEPSSVSNSLELDAKAKLKTPLQFVAAFIRLISEISRRAGEQSKDFDVTNMPGQKKDLQELADQWDKDLSCAEATFKTYIKGLCSFSQGRSRSDFYRNLFIEIKFKSK